MNFVCYELFVITYPISENFSDGFHLAKMLFSLKQFVLFSLVFIFLLKYNFDATSKKYLLELFTTKN